MSETAADPRIGTAGFGGPGVSFLVVERRQADVVAYPDGRFEAVPVGDGGPLARRWNEEQLPAIERDRNERWRAEEEHRRATWEQEQAARKAQLASQGQNLPDKAVVTAAYDEQLDAWRRKRAAALTPDLLSGLKWDRENPQPTLEGVYRGFGVEPPPSLEEDEYQPGSPPPPAARAEVHTGEEVWWARSHGAEPEYDESLGNSKDLPLNAISGLLTELSAAGWRLVHVSEQKSAVHHEDRSDTICTAVTYVLQRSGSQA